MRSQPLTGVQVLDLSRLLPGPVCTLHLADMGADVIKVEDPEVGDYARSAYGGTEQAPSAYFLCVNRNKRGLKLDLKQPQGREVFLDLAASANVVVESFRPGVVDRLGIGYEAVRAVNPKIVYCSITGYGQTGPYRDRAGHDLNYCAYTGITDQIGLAEGPPAVPNIQFADLAGGALSGAMAILAALFDAARGGRGRYIDIAIADCTLANAIIPLAAHLDFGSTVPRGQDLLSGGLPCYAVYETADGRYLAVAALEEKFWRAFCEAIDRPDLIPSGLATGKAAASVRADLQTTLRGKPIDYWVAKLDRVDCCASPVLTLEEALQNEQLVARRMFVTTARSPQGRMTQFAFPVKFDGSTFSVTRPAPRRGEHTDEVLEALGYSPSRIAALKRKRIV